MSGLNATIAIARRSSAEKPLLRVAVSLTASDVVVTRMLAVRRGTTHRLGREVAACTTAIFYHYGVSEALAEFLPDKAGDNVGDAAGGECDLQRDRLRRVGLRP